MGREGINKAIVLNSDASVDRLSEGIIAMVTTSGCVKERFSIKPPVKVRDNKHFAQKINQ